MNPALSPEHQHQNQPPGRSARKTGERSLFVRPTPSFQYHLALETKRDFSIILRLENAEHGNRLVVAIQIEEFFDLFLKVV